MLGRRKEHEAKSLSHVGFGPSFLFSLLLFSGGDGDREGATPLVSTSTDRWEKDCGLAGQAGWRKIPIPNYHTFIELCILYYLDIVHSCNFMYSYIFLGFGCYSLLTPVWVWVMGDIAKMGGVEVEDQSVTRDLGDQKIFAGLWLCDCVYFHTKALSQCYLGN